VVHLHPEEAVLEAMLRGWGAQMARELADGAVPDAWTGGIARAFPNVGERWLFPGRGPGKPLGQVALRKELMRLGIHCRAARNTALLTLARDVPTVVLSDLLGVGISTAERWRQFAGGSWTTYAPAGGYLPATQAFDPGPSVGWRSNNPLTSGWAWRTVGIVKVNVVERSRVRVRVATAFVLALALVVAVALPSYAYHLEGPTWGGQPSAGTCCAHITVGIESSDSADTNAWADGISVWNSSAAFLYFDRPGDYKIGLAEINDSGNSSDGYTSYYYVFGNFTSMSAWLNHYWIAGYPSLKSRGVAAHELGHVAGLAHSDGCVVMQAYSVPRESCGISYPVSDDINGVNAMY